MILKTLLILELTLLFGVANTQLVVVVNPDLGNFFFFLSGVRKHPVPNVGEVYFKVCLVILKLEINEGTKKIKKNHVVESFSY